MRITVSWDSASYRCKITDVSKAPELHSSSG